MRQSSGSLLGGTPALPALPACSGPGSISEAWPVDRCTGSIEDALREWRGRSVDRLIESSRTSGASSPVDPSSTASRHVEVVADHRGGMLSSFFGSNAMPLSRPLVLRRRVELVVRGWRLDRAWGSSGFISPARQRSAERCFPVVTGVGALKSSLRGRAGNRDRSQRGAKAASPRRRGPGGEARPCRSKHAASRAGIREDGPCRRAWPGSRGAAKARPCYVRHISGKGLPLPRACVDGAVLGGDGAPACRSRARLRRSPAGNRSRRYMAVLVYK